MNLIPYFTERGGWVLDAQFMDQMGAPFLMAHGLGHPVQDAVAQIESRCNKTLDLWIRTRDWVSPHGPGLFEVFINGVAFGPFGKGCGDWHWERAGEAVLKEGLNEIRLHDLTGFDGRVAGLLLLPPGANPPIAETEQAACLDLGMFDFVVVGGGYAGMCAAVAAARQGLRVAIIQDRPVFGGNASSEVRVGPIGRLGLGPYKRNSDLAFELSLISKGVGETSGGVRFPPDDNKLESWVREEKNITVLLSTRVVDVEMEGSRIKSVVADNVITRERYRLSGLVFCDATGDGVLGVKAGAHYRFEPESFEETGEALAPKKGMPLNGGYGATNYWLTEWAEAADSFPPCPWAVELTEDNSFVTDAKSAVIGNYPYAAGWNWESGFHTDCVINGERVRDYNFRAAYGMWDFLKNRSKDAWRLKNARLSWLGYVLGKRSAYRLMGDYILCQQDLTEHRVYEDGVVTTTWYLDMHYPHPINAMHFPGGEFRSFAYDDPNFAKEKEPWMVGEYTPIKPYPIPYRCFYSRNIDNLYMAGKDISCTYVGMSSVRVENTTAQMGTMVGRAASLCVKHGWTPRELGTSHLDALQRLLLQPGRCSRIYVKALRLHFGGVGVKGLFRYYLRRVFHSIKRVFRCPYMEELAW